jgi:hypothetical protein
MTQARRLASKITAAQPRTATPKIPPAEEQGEQMANGPKKQTTENHEPNEPQPHTLGGTDTYHGHVGPAIAKPDDTEAVTVSAELT